MKVNRLSSTKHRLRRAMVIIAIITAGAAIIGVMAGYRSLVDMYTEQCVITDLNSQIRIIGGNMVKGDVIADVFGLANGVNLAKLDIAEARARVLDKIPNIRSLTVSRRGLNGLDIEIEERVPLAKLNLPKKRDTTGRVVDEDGVVFGCYRGTQQLITIRERTPSAIGTRLTGRMLAAVRLAIAVKTPEFAPLAVIDIDASNPDYITMTLGSDYSRVRIAWTDMDAPNADEPEAMHRQLRHLMQAIRSNVVEGAMLWIATQPDAIYADPTKGNVYNR